MNRLKNCVEKLNVKCEDCGQPLWRRSEDGVIMPTPCACRQKQIDEYERREKERKRRAKADRINKLFENSRLKKRFRKRTFESFRTSAKTLKAYQKALSYAQNFEKYASRGHGLFFYGGYGSGKTHLSAAITNYLVPQGHSVIFATAPDILLKLRDAYGDNGQMKNSEYLLIKSLSECDLLILDDVGKEKTTDWASEKFYSIINARYEDELPTIITSNLTPVEIEPKLGEAGGAIFSRLRECCESVHTGTEDYRIIEKEGVINASRTLPRSKGGRTKK